MAEARQAAEIAALRGLFDVPVGVGLADPRAAHPTPAEAEAVARAIPRRQQEFAAGRAAVRAAFADAGAMAQPVPSGPDRAPVWPAGWRGSLSHSETLCIAVVARGMGALGLDLEPDAPLSDDLIAEVCTAQELAAAQRALGDASPGRAARLVFSAKEAAYKAQYPASHRVLDFAALEIGFAPEGRPGGPGRFSATFAVGVPPFAPGARLMGRWARIAGHLVTGVTIGQAETDDA